MKTKTIHNGIRSCRSRFIKTCTFFALFFLILPQAVHAGAVRAGFDTSVLPANDDGSSVNVPFGFTIDLFGFNYSGCYVNNNGNISFDAPLPTFTPSAIGSLGIKLIAPFWGDVDTRGAGSGLTRYGTGTVGGRPAWGATWDHVGYYAAHTDKLNWFQVILIDRSDIAAGAFDIEFNYNQIQWQTGDASSGVSARAGYTNGTTTSYEVPGSGVTGAFLDSNPTGLVATGGGTLLFQSVNGNITLSTVRPVKTPLGDVVTAEFAPSPTGANDGTRFGALRRGGYLAQNSHLVFPGFLAVAVGAPAISGLWKDNGVTMNRLAMTGTDAPETGATAAKFDVLPQTPAINDSGEVTFLASLAISGASTPPTTVDNDTGLWSELGGTGLGILIREDDAIPGLPAGTKVGAFASGAFATARTGAGTGEAAFAIKMKGTSIDSAILRTSITGAAVTAVGVVARENSAAPGTAENFGVVNGSYSDSMRMDATGNLAFVALTKPSNKEGIWYQPVGGSTAKAFVAGDAAPGTGGATFKSIKSPAIGSGGVITFRGFLNNNGDNTGGKKGDGIWRGTGSTVASYDCILRAGDDNTNRIGLGLPAGAKVGNVWHSWLTNSNRGAWRAWLDVNGNGTSSAADGDANAIFSDLSGTMTYMFKVGDAAPGMPVGATFVSIGLPVVGGVEQLAFLGNVTGGGTTPANSWGIWRSAPNGGALSLVLRTGEAIVTTQGTKTMKNVDFPDTGFLDRRWEQPIMDSAGKLIILVTFTDGTTSQVLVP